MKIAVLIKQVPDTETKIKLAPDAKQIESKDVKFIVNPYDEFAIEEALQIKARFPEVETWGVSLGPERVNEALRVGLAMGLDKAAWINCEETLDAMQIAMTLVAFFRERNFSLILCGKQAIDTDAAVVPAMIAEFLDWQQVQCVDKVEFTALNQPLRVVRRAGSKEVYTVTLPAVITADKGLNSPRYASLPGIMKAKSKPIEKVEREQLDSSSPCLVTQSLVLPPEKNAGRIIEGEPADQIRELVQALAHEARVL
jgi:electron transfer flavoprotein beta subunit